MAHEREARTKGIPSLGASAIYPVPEPDIVVKPFEILAFIGALMAPMWGGTGQRPYGGALDPETDVLYTYSEHYRGQAEPAIYAQVGRGSWNPGIDPAARGRTQTDGERLLAIYRELGLNLIPADKPVEAGTYAAWQRLPAGKLKVFSTLENWLQEFRIYRRDEKDRVVRENDHATRHLIEYDPMKEMWKR
jgi:hypothetical protein